MHSTSSKQHERKPWIFLRPCRFRRASVKNKLLCALYEGILEPRDIKTYPRRPYRFHQESPPQAGS
jgi:hypothetical protein